MRTGKRRHIGMAWLLGFLILTSSVWGESTLISVKKGEKGNKSWAVLQFDGEVRWVGISQLERNKLELYFWGKAGDLNNETITMDGASDRRVSIRQVNRSSSIFRADIIYEENVPVAVLKKDQNMFVFFNDIEKATVYSRDVFAASGRLVSVTPAVRGDQVRTSFDFEGACDWTGYFRLSEKRAALLFQGARLTTLDTDFPFHGSPLNRVQFFTEEGGNPGLKVLMSFDAPCSFSIARKQQGLIIQTDYTGPTGEQEYYRTEEAAAVPDVVLLEEKGEPAQEEKSLDELVQDMEQELKVIDDQKSEPVAAMQPVEDVLDLELPPEAEKPIQDQGARDAQELEPAVTIQPVEDPLDLLLPPDKEIPSQDQEETKVQQTEPVVTIQPVEEPLDLLLPPEDKKPSQEMRERDIPKTEQTEIGQPVRDDFDLEPLSDPEEEKPPQKEDEEEMLIPWDERVSFEFDEIPIKDALRLVASANNLNMVIGGGVEGSVTMDLESVTLRQALEMIVHTHECEYIVDHGIITVKPVRTVYTGGSITKVYKLKYADADNVAEVIRQVVSGDTLVQVYRPEFLSFPEAGKNRKEENPVAVQGIHRSSTLVVTDRPEKIREVDRVIAELDKPPVQIVIESKLVELAPMHSNELGINWDKTINTVLWGQKILASGDELDYSFLNDAPGQDGEWKVANLSAGKYQAVLDFLKEKTDSKLKSNPRLLAMDNEESSISVGTTVPVPRIQRGLGGQGDMVTFEYKEVNIQLNVTPHVGDKNEITMYVNPVIEEITGWVEYLQHRAPITDKRAVNSIVSVKNGETVVIGGLIKSQRIKTLQKVWLLGNLPLVGRLFQHEKYEDKQTDLMIFITPTIVNAE